MKIKHSAFHRSRRMKHTQEPIESIKAVSTTEKVEFLNSIATKYYNISAKNLIDNFYLNTGNEFDGRYIEKMLIFLINVYDDGVTDKNGEFVIRPNIKLGNYYKFIMARRIKKNEAISGAELSDEHKKIIDSYKIDYEEIDKSYFEVVKFKYKKKDEIATAHEKINISKDCIADLRKLNDSESLYARGLAIVESLKYGEFKECGFKTNLDRLNQFIDDCRQNCEIKEGSKIYNLLISIYLNGIKDNFGNYIVEPRGKQINECRENQQLDIKDGKKGKSYVCSDIHGQFEVYNDIVKHLKNDDKLYIIGDVIDKGDDGIKILQDVIERSKTGQVEFILGNHEIMMLKAIYFNIQMDLWMDPDNGGMKTYEEYQKLSEAEKKSILSFLARSLVVKNIVVNNQKIQLVHANRCIDFDSENISYMDIVKKKYGNDVTEKDLTWKRKLDDVDNDAIVIVGHNPNNSQRIETDRNYFKIDCGAASGVFGRVGVLCLDDFKVRYYDIKRQERE